MCIDICPKSKRKYFSNQSLSPHSPSFRHSRSLPGSPLRDVTSSARKTWVGIGSQLLRQLDRWNVVEGTELNDEKIDEFLSADARAARKADKKKRQKSFEEGDVVGKEEM